MAHPAYGQGGAPNEPPEVTGEVRIEYAENGEAEVTTYTAADPEGASITWAVSGTDGAAFSITAGALEFLVPPNYENPADGDGDNLYRVEVRATDPSGASDSIEVAINVTDVNDPNIVLIMADDVGYEAFGAYGSKQYRTPRIDELAADGVRFTNAFSKPLCTPSRVALMTGKSNVRNYVDFGVLLPGQDTIADLFREAGYATAIAGKWQLHGGASTVTGVAAGTGFDTYCLWHTANTGNRRYWNPSIECDGEIIDTGRDDYGPDIFADFLLEFIETNRERPFFAYYPMVLPHNPFEPPPQAQCPSVDDKQCNFEDMVAYLDHSFGRIRDKLADLKLLDNTILVFSSDNGTRRTLVSDLGVEAIHGDKAMPTDGGTHVPLIVHVPGVSGGRVLDDLIDFTDFLPTLADAAGLTIPNREELDGVSFWDRLQGDPGRPREWLYTYYFPRPYENSLDAPSTHPEVFFARDKRYKLYGTGELFDVTADRHELRPLPSDDEDSSAARASLQAALDSMPERGQEIRWPRVTAVASEPRPRWRPVLVEATVNGADLALVYAGLLNRSVVPAAGDFTVKVNDAERMVSAVSLDSAHRVTLALASPVAMSQTVTVDYTPGTNPIQHANRRAGHTAAALTDEAVKNETPLPNGPTVSSLAIISNPGTDGTYAAEDQIRIAFTFSETVEVQGTPQLTLRLGSQDRQAAYQSVLGTAAIFAYTVTAGESDTDGVSIEANRLSLNGGTIKDGAGNDALLDHPGLAADSAHRVDAVAPDLLSAAVDGATLTMTFGEALARRSAPRAGDFTVIVDDAARTVSGVSLSGNSLVLTLDPAVEHRDSRVTVSYRPGTNPIRDAAGNKVKELSNEPVTNSTQVSDAAPQITSTGPFTVIEGQVAIATLAATDNDTETDQLVWSIPASTAGGADGDKFELSANGALAFLAAKDFEAPDDANADGIYEVTVQVMDGQTPVTADLRVTLRNRNEAPEADAGPDQEGVAEASTVTLNGSGTDPDADDTTETLGFQWRQTDSGAHRVVLSNARAAIATFTAPTGVTEDAVLRFALTVTDDGGLSGQDEVEVTVREADPPEVSISASSISVTEGTSAAFPLALSKAATEALTVLVGVSETGSMLSGTPPASVTFAKGDTRATLSVPTEADSVVEADGTITATVTAGTGYTVGRAASASIAVEDDDTATFTVSAAPDAIAEGESATLKVAISNGVTFAEDQTVALSVSGTASAADYSGIPAALTLAAGASSATTELAASADQDEEEAETVAITASHGGSSIGSATVTLNSISHDATLSALSLSGIDIGKFSSEVTSYQASVGHSVETVTVGTAAGHSGATVRVEPGSEVSLAVGANEIVITVTAEDGETTRTYTVTVTRAAVDRAEQLRRAELDLDDLDDNVPFGLWSDGTTLWASMWWSVGLVAFDLNTNGRLYGRDIATVAVNASPTGLWSDGTTLWASDYGGGVYAYRLADGERLPGEDLARTLQAAGNDRPTGLWSDGTTLWVLDYADAHVYAYRLADKVRDEDREFALADGAGQFGLWSDGTTVWTADFNGGRVAAYRLADGGRDTARDYDTSAVGNETPISLWSDGETLWVGDRYDEKLYAYALEASADATLASLTLSGIEIGTFDPATTDYATSAGSALSSTTVTATPNSAGASVTISDFTGSTTDAPRDVLLAVGANTITVTVTAADGQTTATYTATVTRAYLAPTFTVTAGESTIAEGGSTTVTVAIANGVRFAADQAITLTAAGTAAASDYTLDPTTLTLGARKSEVAATLTAVDDETAEPDETVTVSAAHNGSTVGTATVTIRSVSHDATLKALSLAGIDIGTFSGTVTSYQASIGHSVATTTVTATPTHSAATVSIQPGVEVSLAEGANEIVITVTAEDGTSTKTYAVTVTRSALPVATITAGTTAVSEGTAASFTVTLAEAAAEPLTVSVSVTESGSALSGTSPDSVAFATGETSTTLTVPTAGDSVAEAASTVTATVKPGTGYSVGPASSASVTVEDDDVATFTVTAVPEAIAEGEDATLTVAISNGVTFAEDQSIELALFGTASASDYAGVPASLTLAAGASSTTAELTASEDQDEEGAETVTVTASHGGSSIGSATLTIKSISHNATLSALSLSGIDIGTFSGEVTSYQASVGHSVATTTVTATPTHSAATASIQPGPEVSLAEGDNEVAVTVTAEDGETTRTYTVTVKRAAPPEATIRADTTPVPEGTAASFTVTLAEAAGEPLRVSVSVTESGSALSGTAPASVAFAKGETSATLTVPTAGDRVVETDSAVTATLTPGTGYRVGAASSASVLVEDDDTATFTVSVVPEAISEGESATLTVAISNGVTFAEDQSIELALSGTASASDYTEVPASLTLAAGASSVTAELAAAEDQEEEQAETVAITASHGGSSIGSVMATINSVSHDATLSALSLSGIDIGPFSGEVTSYRASVAQSVATTTVRATPTHSAATVSIEPGAEVSLAEGANEVAVTVTAEDGTTTRIYTVTVTRAGLPVIAVVAVASPVSEGQRAEFTVTRTGPTSEALTAQASWAVGGHAEVQTTAVLFQAGRSSKTPYYMNDDDTVVREDVTVTLTLQEGEGYTVSAEQASAAVVLEENDVPEFAVSVDPAEIAEGETATVRVRTTNGVTFEADQAIPLDFAGSTAAEGADFSIAPGSLTLRGGQIRGESSVAATLTATEDRDEEGDETVLVAARHGGETVGTATLTITNRAWSPLTAQLAGMPETHDGETAFRFELRFSEQPAVSYRTLRDAAFEVTGGVVRRARRIEPPSNLRWEIHVEPVSEADVALALPATADCGAAGAICTAGGKPLSNRVEATVQGPGSQPAGGFPLAPENGRPSGLWSDGETAWVADLEDARLYAYSREGGARVPERDIATGPVPMGLWADGETLWVAGLGGGLRAHRLADGARLPSRDLAAGANTAPAGVWSDGKTAWVSDWLGDTVHAYGLASGRREPGRDIRLAGGNLMPVGLWSDGQTLWVADWRELVYAYRLSDGGREPGRDVAAGTGDTDPTGLWAGGGTLLATGWEGGRVRAYRLPAEPVAEGTPGKGRGGFLPARAASLPAVADPALVTAITAALGKAPGESVSAGELARLEALEARSAGVRDLAGLEGAVSLKELDLGFNPLADLRPLAALPALESLNLDGAVVDLQELAPLAGLKRLSLRHNGIEDLAPLAGLGALAELDVGDNRIADLGPLAGLASLAVLRADRNRIADPWPLAALSGLEALDLGANRVRDLQPLAGLTRLRMLRLAGNGLAELHPLSGLEHLQDLGLGGNGVESLHALTDLRGLRRLDLRGNPVGDLRPLVALPSLVWVHVGGSRIDDLSPLHGRPGLTVAGSDDRQAPTADGHRAGGASQQ